MASDAFGGSAQDFAYRISQLKSASGWNANTIAPPPIQNPFTNIEDVVKTAKETKSAYTPITAEDFKTQAIPLTDPKLASRAYSSVPRTQPIEYGASISAYGVGNVPAYLTEAVNKLNAQQSQAEQAQANYRQQLMDAVLSGNYLAAEALRAASVQKGASVAFGSQVADPNVGAGYALQSQAAAQEAQTRTGAYKTVADKTAALAKQLQDVERSLGTSTSATTSPFLGVQGGSDLQLQQWNIRRELERQQKLLAQGGGYRPSAYAAVPTVSLVR